MLRLVRHTAISIHSASMDTLVRRIAEQSMPAVRRRLHAHTAAMSISELRGYVRARALAAVHTQAGQVLATGHLGRTIADELMSRSLERTVHMIVRERTAQPILAMPVAHVPVRAAA